MKGAAARSQVQAAEELVAQAEAPPRLAVL